MMSEQVLIGEAGGTGTHWRLAKGESMVGQFVTPGYNPQTSSLDDVLTALHQQLSDHKAISRVHFYAAGLITEDHFSGAKQAFQQMFPNAQIEVQNDAMAAARGLCGHSAGWIGFLGTGSGMVYYDGKTIAQKIDSLGFIVGDEGSGAYIGKLLTRDYFRHRLPEVLVEQFSDHFQELGPELAKIYRTTNGNTHLARLAAVIHPFRDMPYVDQLIRQAFNDYVDAFVTSEITEAIHFTGSVAYHFNTILREVLQKRGLIPGRIIQSPIAGLLLFHE